MSRVFTMLQIIRRLHAGKPVALSFNVTHRCNLACLMCNIHQSPIEELSLDQIDMIMADVATAGFQIVEITGGEPFLRRDLFSIFDILDRYGFHYTLNTNGLLLSRERVRQLKQHPGVLQIAVSIDSLDRELFAFIRGADVLPKVLEGLDCLINEGPRVPIKVNLTVNRFNYREIDSFLAFCRQRHLFLSVFPVNLGSDFRHRGLDERLVPTDDERAGMARMFRRLAELRRRGDVLWEHSFFYRGAEDYLVANWVPPCDAGRLFFDLHADGQIAVCNDLPPFGDLRREKFKECLRRLPDQRCIVRHCYETHPCYYTCTYAISAIARHKVRYIYENLRAMGISGLFRNYIGATRLPGKQASGPITPVACLVPSRPHQRDSPAESSPHTTDCGDDYNNTLSDSECE